MMDFVRAWPSADGLLRWWWERWKRRQRRFALLENEFDRFAVSDDEVPILNYNRLPGLQPKMRSQCRINRGSTHAEKSNLGPC